MSETGADLAYRALRALGVEHVFGIVSVHNIPIYDAILRNGGITPIDMRHEQAAVHAADGYARSGGKLGVAHHQHRSRRVQRGARSVRGAALRRRRC